MNNRKRTILVYMSARPVIEPIRIIGERLGQLVAARGDAISWGCGDTGLMGTVAESAFLKGAETFGVAHGGLARGGNEAASQHATISMIQDNFHERIRIMQCCPDGVIVMPGGFGSYQELLRFLKALEEASISPTPVVLISPAIGSKEYWHHTIEQLKLSVARGHLKPKTIANLHAVPDEVAAYEIIDKYYETYTDSEWSKHKSGQLIHVAQHHATVSLPDGRETLLKHLNLPGEFVAVVGSSLGTSALKEENKQAYDAIPCLMDLIEASGHKVLCINSNRGINHDIMSHAARRGILGMVLSTDAHINDGRVETNVAGAISAKFDNATQLSGFLTRRAKKVFALPGADDVLMDLISDFAIRSHGFGTTEVLAYNSDGYYTQMLQQIQFSELPLFAVRDDTMIGLASSGIAGAAQSDARINPIVPFAFTDQDFFQQALRILYEPRQHYKVARPNYSVKVDIPGMVIGNNPGDLEVARTILHGEDIARPSRNSRRRASEALRIAEIRRGQLLLELVRA